MMTLKIIKLFFIGTFLIIGTNCENEEWIELNLTDNYCNEIINEETGYINDHEGILISNDDSSPAFLQLKQINMAIYCLAKKYFSPVIYRVENCFMKVK